MKETLYGNIPKDVFTLFSHIKVLILDVDGVLSDGVIYLTESGDEIKSFYALDGYGLRLLLKYNFKIVVITGRRSDLLARRLKSLGIDSIYQGVSDKLSCLKLASKTLGFSLESAAFMGDDLVDLPSMLACSLSLSVPLGHPFVIESSHYVTRRLGGQGAVREICDLLLLSQGLLKFDSYGTSG